MPPELEMSALLADDFLSSVSLEVLSALSNVLPLDAHFNMVVTFVMKVRDYTE